ncbi:MAG: 5'-methylthioadenosine/adenosylhomocysteine nucleosidase [Gammaproteobacteria bacterium]
MKIAIMAAMPEEVNTIHDVIPFEQEVSQAKRTYYIGQFNGIEVILVYSRCGKVSAASTATTLIEKFRVDEIIFTGVAGAVDQQLNVGDVVLGVNAYQHDMDARPLFPRFEVPLTDQSLHQTCEKNTALAKKAISNFIDNKSQYIGNEYLEKFKLHSPSLHVGTIATGDQFINNPSHHEGLKFDGNHVLAVEMEGAAVAQVCEEHEIPCVLIRTISDKADHSAPINFQDFITNVASHYSSGIVREYLKLKS